MYATLLHYSIFALYLSRRTNNFIPFQDGGRCTGTTINVDGSGRAKIRIDNGSDDPQIAIHVEAKL